jgi:hypothetical protein
VPAVAGLAANPSLRASVPVSDSEGRLVKESAAPLGVGHHLPLTVGDPLSLAHPLRRRHPLVAPHPSSSATVDGNGGDDSSGRSGGGHGSDD